MRNILIKTAAVAIAVIAIGLALAALSSIFAHNNILVYILSGFLLALAGYLFRLSKQLVLVAAPLRLSDDKLAPVLYLRMFRDDWVSQTPADGIFVTEEESLVSVLSDFGPVVALGIPGEKLPGLGAIREYVTHDAWQQHVHDYMNKAALVVVRLTPRATENLLWEFKEAIRQVAPNRLILLVPQPHYYEAFRQLAIQAEPSKPLPTYPVSALRQLTMGEKFVETTAAAMAGPFVTESTVALEKGKKFMPRWASAEWHTTALIYFKPDGTPCFEPFAIPKGRQFNIATAFRYAMKPVFRQLGVQWRDAPRDLGELAMRIFWWSTYLVIFIIIATATIINYIRHQ